MDRKLILENGAVFEGKAFGSEREYTGEVIFTTSMTGYQELLSDPSSCDYLMTFTYPLVGNYGINRDDFESLHPSVGGVIVKEHATKPSNFRSMMSLDEWLKEKDIPGISGIDTRKLTRMLRKEGTLIGRITSLKREATDTMEELRAFQPSRDRVKKVSTKNAYHVPGSGKRVVLLDFGVKHSIIKNLIERGTDIFVLPYDTSYEEVMTYNPDGIVLSNGPGNPVDVKEAIKTVKLFIGKFPLFGIGLGYQLICLASGAKIVKMHTGHHGTSHPVKNLQNNRVYMTSQNHAYTVERESLVSTPLEVTHIHVNDGTVEGVAHKTEPVFGVQFHPEASPGPRDMNDIFDSFITRMGAEKPTY